MQDQYPHLSHLLSPSYPQDVCPNSSLPTYNHLHTLHYYNQITPPQRRCCPFHVCHTSEGLLVHLVSSWRLLIGQWSLSALPRLSYCPVSKTDTLDACSALEGYRSLPWVQSTSSYCADVGFTKRGQTMKKQNLRKPVIGSISRL